MKWQFGGCVGGGLVAVVVVVVDCVGGCGRVGGGLIFFFSLPWAMVVTRRLLSVEWWMWLTERFLWLIYLFYFILMSSIYYINQITKNIDPLILGVL